MCGEKIDSKFNNLFTNSEILKNKDDIRYNSISKQLTFYDFSLFIRFSNRYFFQFIFNKQVIKLKYKRKYMEYMFLVLNWSQRRIT